MLHRLGRRSPPSIRSSDSPQSAGSPEDSPERHPATAINSKPIQRQSPNTSRYSPFIKELDTGGGGRKTYGAMAKGDITASSATKQSTPLKTEAASPGRNVSMETKHDDHNDEDQTTNSAESAD